MKSLVTGGTGFIGSHLVEALIRRGDQVRCLIRNPSHLKWLKDLPIEIVQGNCNDTRSLKSAVTGVDQLFHLAGVTKALDERTYFEINAQGTENLVHACLEHNPHLQKFIYLSSQAAAGPCQNGRPKKETDPCEPVSPYGRSKRMGEDMALAHAHELPLLILRPCAVYGPRDRAIYAFFKLLSKKIKPCFYRQEQHISLCFVGDIVEAMLLASERKEANGEIFFLSDGQDYRMEEVGDIFASAMGVNPVSIRVPEWMIYNVASLLEYFSKLTRKPALLNRGKVEEMIQKNWVCDITKAKTVLGFKPQVSLADGARLTFEWYKKENWL
ncbi:MAG: NAD-dependent epimerase/dehydratase family protein [Thermodesulfobacteriota bacterium]